jgi:hypothetical protein
MHYKPLAQYLLLWQYIIERWFNLNWSKLLAYLILIAGIILLFYSIASYEKALIKELTTFMSLV